MPRLALATSGLGPDPSPVGLAMLASLSWIGCTTQHYRARACPTGSRLVGEISGLPGRHLDAWLMPPEVCRGVLAYGYRNAKMCVVEGTLDEPDELDWWDDDRTPLCTQPGPLLPIADAIGAPIVAVLSCPEVANLHLPRLPERVDAVILDGILHSEEFPKLREIAELLLKRPVLGGLEALPDVRAALVSPESELAPEPGLIVRLMQSFIRLSDLGAIQSLAESRPYPAFPPLVSGRGRPFRVAYANDDAFGGYFPDTLELLEALGADLVEFSPLADESLPEGLDLIMIGCGFPDNYAEELAGNVNLSCVLKSMVCRGTRIYAEGGGAAYLARQLILGDQVVPGVGILPVDAVRLERPRLPHPVERTLIRSSWMGKSGSIVRGYHSGRWQFQPAPEPGDCPARSGQLTSHRDMHFRRNAIGSLIHIHLAAMPDVVAAFVGSDRMGVAGH